MFRLFKKKRILNLMVISFLMGAVFVLGGYAAYNSLINPGATKAETEYLENQNDFAPPQNVISADITQIVKKAGPAVVNINTITKTESVRYNPFFDDPFFREFFGRDFGFDLGPRVSRGLGTGFIFRKDGYILTNEHVIHGAQEIKVTVAGYDQDFKAEVIGSDYELDLAVIKIDAPDDLPVLKLGESEDAQVGEWVIAIGNPYGLDHTVTVGVLSAKGRPVEIQDRVYKDLLQTDAAINPGNSGGPLLNLKGEVIGINTAINAAAQGIGFAIPSSTVKEVLEELISKGKVVRPWMGVILQEVTKDLAEILEYEGTEGAVISYVAPEGPADKAGLRRGDIIIEIDKKSIKTPDDVVNIIKNSQVGRKHVLLVHSRGVTKYVTVTLEEKPGSN